MVKTRNMHDTINKFCLLGYRPGFVILACIMLVSDVGLGGEGGRSLKPDMFNENDTMNHNNLNAGDLFFMHTCE